jgi:hypothetical protein
MTIYMSVTTTFCIGHKSPIHKIPHCIDNMILNAEKKIHRSNKMCEFVVVLSDFHS